MFAFICDDPAAGVAPAWPNSAPVSGQMARDYLSHLLWGDPAGRRARHLQPAIGGKDATLAPNDKIHLSIGLRTATTYRESKRFTRTPNRRLSMVPGLQVGLIISYTALPELPVQLLELEQAVMIPAAFTASPQESLAVRLQAGDENNA